MKMDLKYESHIDLNQPQHIAAPRNLINALMKSVGEHGEFRIELGGVLHYGTYMVAKPGEMVEVQVARLKKRLRKSPSMAKPQTSSRRTRGRVAASSPLGLIPQDIVNSSSGGFSCLTPDY